MFVGVVNTLFGSALMFALYNIAGWGYWLSSAVNYTISSVLSFFLNKYLTFQVKHWSVSMIALFALTIIVAYLTAYGIAKPLIHWLLCAYSQKVRDNTALLAGMCLFTGLNYIGQRFVAFKTKE
jgi:putative flippase GtrA